jgi:hypothetical protein
LWFGTLRNLKISPVLLYVLVCLLTLAESTDLVGWGGGGMVVVVVVVVVVVLHR